MNTAHATERVFQAVGDIGDAEAKRTPRPAGAAALGSDEFCAVDSISKCGREDFRPSCSDEDQSKYHS